METRRRLVRRIPAEGLDPRGYGTDVFLFASRHLIVVCTQTCIFHCCIVFKEVVCRLYEMFYPCSCNVVILCWKSGAYYIVICRGGTDMCFVPGSGWKHVERDLSRMSRLRGVPSLPCHPPTGNVPPPPPPPPPPAEPPLRRRRALL